MGQLLKQDSAAFVRYGIAQMTRGSVDETLADEMIERLPMERAVETWTRIHAQHFAGVDRLRALGLPLLLAKHEGCLIHTDEGWQDIVAAFPDARSLVCETAPLADPAFAEALRVFCEAAPG